MAKELGKTRLGNRINLGFLRSRFLSFFRPSQCTSMGDASAAAAMAGMELPALGSLMELLCDAAIVPESVELGLLAELTAECAGQLRTRRQHDHA
jgi:hypothetical protein